MTLFYYEVYEHEYDEDSKEWSAFMPESSFITDVQVPTQSMGPEHGDVVKLFK
jgi:hypothetical protein